MDKNNKILMQALITMGYKTQTDAQRGQKEISALERLHILLKYERPHLFTNLPFYKMDVIYTKLILHSNTLDVN